MIIKAIGCKANRQNKMKGKNDVNLKIFAIKTEIKVVLGFIKNQFLKPVFL